MSQKSQEKQRYMIFDLPQDVIEEIFSRVPVPYLRRTRSTCKRLNVLLKNPGFIKRHFANTAKQYQTLMLMNFNVNVMSSNLHAINMDVDPLFKGEVISLIDPQLDSEVEISQAFHCDGILLCTTKENRLVAWKPFSNQTRWFKPQNHETYVLGYDNKDLCHNYKFLRFPDPYYKELETSENSWRNLYVSAGGDLKLKIYEFNSNSWRNLDVITPEGCLKSCGVSLKGNTYWVYVSERSGVNDYSLLSFDFSTERFQHLCVPFHQEAATCFDTMALSVVREERLSLLYQSNETLKMEIWMTNEIETTSVTWRKFLTVELEPCLPMFSSRMTFLIDVEEKVAICCERDGKVYIVGKDGYRVSPGFNFYDYKGITCCPTIFGYVPRLV